MVVGIGPGSHDQMTIRADRALAACDVIVGYPVYVDLVREYYPGKVFLTTPMRREEERCRLAFERASEGWTTALVCSGDPGVYGLAGLVLGIARDYPDTEVEIVPGVTAALSGAALLGAPLIHDFCLISLSDLLTPREVIEKRLSLAAEADFVICLYNPSSRKRAGYLAQACDRILAFRAPDTVCGITQSIGREGESLRVLTLRELRDAEADMFTTVFIGNSRTHAAGGRMITPRGYANE